MNENLQENHQPVTPPPTSRFLKSHRQPELWHVYEDPMHLHLPPMIAQPAPRDALSSGHLKGRPLEGTAEKEKEETKAQLHFHD